MTEYLIMIGVTLRRPCDDNEVLNKVYESLRSTMETLDDVGLIESHRIDGRKTKVYGGQSDTTSE